MSLAGLVVFVRGPRDFLSTEGLRKFWVVLACFLVPAVFSLFGAINFERSLSGAVRFFAYGFAVWALLQIKLDRGESYRLMSLIGALMMLWVVDVVRVRVLQSFPGPGSSAPGAPSAKNGQNCNLKGIAPSN